MIIYYFTLHKQKIIAILLEITGKKLTYPYREQSQKKNKKISAPGCHPPSHKATEGKPG